MAALSVAGESAKKATSDPDVNPELIRRRKRSVNRSNRSMSIPSAIKTSIVNKWGSY
ncbi:MAG: hypothetical protein ACJ0P9_01545 [Flavobacteriaceae bacterium]